MGLIERYISEVLRRLPASRHEAAEQELRKQIETIRARAGLSIDQENDVETVLKQMGHPALWADRLRGDGQALIGPGIYYLYGKILRIVLIAVSAGLLLAMTVKFMVSAGARPVQVLLEMIGALFNGLLGAFGAVTLIFAAVERYLPQTVRISPKDPFDPKDLPQLISEKDRMHRAEPVAAIVFIVIAMVAAVDAPRFIGFYPSGLASESLVPLFQESVYRYYLPLILVVLGLGLFGEITKLVVGRWTVRLALLHLLLGIPSVLLTIVMFSDPNLLNSGFFTQMFKTLESSDPMILNLPIKLFLSRLLIGITVFGFAADLITTMTRAIRLSSSRGLQFSVPMRAKFHSKEINR